MLAYTINLKFFLFRINFKRRICDAYSLLAVVAILLSALSGAAQKSTDTKRILFVLSNSVQVPNTAIITSNFAGDIANPLAIFRANGFLVDFVSPLGGPVLIYGAENHTGVGEDTLEVEFLKRISDKGNQILTKSPRQVNPADFQGVLFVGGGGMLWDSPADFETSKLVGTIYENQGVVGATSYGIIGLSNVRLSDGKPLLSGVRIASMEKSTEDKLYSQLGWTVKRPFYVLDKLTNSGAVSQFSYEPNTRVIANRRIVTGLNDVSGRSVAEMMVRLMHMMH